jgi:hypothetical protein
MMKRLLTALALLSAFGCGARPAGVTAPTAAAETLALRFETAHFRVHAGRASDATLRAAADRLEAQYARITTELGVAGLAPIAVKVWQDEASYFAELTRYFGMRYSAAGYVTGRDEIRVLAVPQLDTNVVHEFAHAASLYVNPSFGNNPRWLWEAVALFENGELVDPRRLDYMVRGNYPTLQQLNADPNAGRQVYDLGYTLAEFVVARWGRAALIRLIQTNADLPGVVGLSPAAFEDAWAAWLRERYLS